MLVEKSMQNALVTVVYLCKAEIAITIMAFIQLPSAKFRVAAA